MMIRTDWHLSCAALHFGSQPNHDGASSCARARYLLETGAGQGFPGSMGPKVVACTTFVGGRPAGHGCWAAIGSLADAAEIVAGRQGTIVTKDMEEEVEWRGG
jgi:carbamate kinase